MGEVWVSEAKVFAGETYVSEAKVFGECKVVLATTSREVPYSYNNAPTIICQKREGSR